MLDKSRRSKTSRTTKRTRKAEHVVDLPKTNRRQYSEAEKLAAVTAALTANKDHPIGIAALTAACAALGETIHVSTLDDWLRLYRQQVEATLTAKPVDVVITETRDKTMADMLKARELAGQQLLDTQKAKQASYRDSGVVFGILHDKIENAIGVSAEESALLDRMRHDCDLIGVDYRQTLIDFVEYIHSKVPTLQDKVRQAAALTSGSDAAADGDDEVR